MNTNKLQIILILVCLFYCSLVCSKSLKTTLSQNYKINLNDFVTNDNGNLKWGGSGYMLSCGECKLDNKILKCGWCKNRQGSKVPTSLDLTRKI